MSITLSNLDGKWKISMYLFKTLSMKITKEQLKTLIKEEASRIRKEMNLEKEKTSKKLKLENRKTEIMSKLNEMYGEDVQEIFGLGKSAEQKAAEKAEAEMAFQKKVLSHPVGKKAVSLVMSKGIPEADAIKQVVSVFNETRPETPRMAWDEKLKKIVNKSTYGGTTRSLAEKETK